MCFSFLNMFNSTRPGKRLHNTNWTDPPFYSWENPRTFDWVIFNSYFNITRPGTSRMKPSRFESPETRSVRTVPWVSHTVKHYGFVESHVVIYPGLWIPMGPRVPLFYRFCFGGYPASNSSTGIVDPSVCFPRGPGPQTSAEPRDVESFCHRILNSFRSVNARSYRKCQSHTALGHERESCC